MKVSTEYLDNIIVESGGFGRYQIMLLTLVLVFGKLTSTWTMLIMSVAGAIPDWWCEDNVTYTTYDNQTSLFKTCNPGNQTKCSKFSYDGSMRTVVSEWDLVCDRAWIPSTITTIQMAGYLISAVISGQFSDTFGRKPTLFISTLSLAILNLVAYFSVSWQMFAALRFLLGFFCANYLAVYYPLLAEFIPAKQRPIAMAIPSWTLWAAVMGFVAWLIPDWANLHLTTAALTVPILCTWWIVPESFRWLLSKHRVEDAEKVIAKMAKMNKRPVPDTSQLKHLADTKHKTEYYSVRDLFRSWKLAKSSILLSLMWMFSGYTYYAIAFGVQKLSGSIYLNMFLISAVELPGNAATYYMSNKLGRKWTCVLYYLLSGVAAFGVAIVEVIDIDPSIKGGLINGFALTARIGNSAGWCALCTLTTETYPTVIRNIGYGFQSTTARIGSMIAPQVVYLSFLVPGLMYFLCGATMIVSAICAGLSEETRDKPLTDTMEIKRKSSKV